MGNNIVGVGFLLFIPGNECLKIFTVRELQSKPALSKMAGMLSFPLETFSSDDVDYMGTIRRLLKEEVGVFPEQVKICGISPRELYLIPGRSDIVTCYGFGIFLGDPNQIFQPGDNDVAFAGWMSPLALLRHNYVRIEVRPVLFNFFRSGAHKQVLNPPVIVR